MAELLTLTKSVATNHVVGHAPSSFAPYLTAFDDPSEGFLVNLRLDRGGRLSEQTFTRGEFWQLACKAATVIRNNGLERGDCFVNAFGGNQVGDLAFRLAAAMTGTVPVTTNWQADPIERILYKVKVTESRLILTDDLIDPSNVEAIGTEFPTIPQFHIGQLSEQKPLAEEMFAADLQASETRIIIFTSGTTGQPKGVQLPYRAYETNAATYESFLETEGERLALVIANPMHHTNSTGITDWALRRSRTRIFFLEKYTTAYWKALADVAERGFDRVVAPLVARHVDFLENLITNDQLPIPTERLFSAMKRVDILIGSAPVGPTTIKRLVSYSGRIPIVRYGSTEACLQVIGIPRSNSEANKYRAFDRGWKHTYEDAEVTGFYIGRAHPPFTEVRIVKSCEPGSSDSFVDCEEGEPGLLITRGRNLMTRYVNDEASSLTSFHDGWYTGLGDVCFFLVNEDDGERDYYWVSRESALMIRGGSNYSYEQIGDELKAFVVKRFGLDSGEFSLAVVGLRAQSEHEDECCVTIELLTERAKAMQPEIHHHFLNEARGAVSKGSYPDYLRFDTIPRNFKGAVLVPELKTICKAGLSLP